MSRSGFGVCEKTAVAKLVGAAKPTQQRTPTAAARPSVPRAKWLSSTAIPHAITSPEGKRQRRDVGQPPGIRRGDPQPGEEGEKGEKAEVGPAGARLELRLGLAHQ